MGKIYYDVSFEGSKAICDEFGQPPVLSGQFYNVDFTDADLSNANVQGALFQGVSFIRCNLTKVDFSQAKFIQVGNGEGTGQDETSVL